MFPRIIALFLSVYIPVVVQSFYAMDCGNQAGSDSPEIWDGDSDPTSASFFESSQAGAAIAGVSCAGWQWPSSGGSGLVFFSGPLWISWLQSNTTTQNAAVMNIDGWDGSTWTNLANVSTGTAAGWKVVQLNAGTYSGMRLMPYTFAGSGRWRIYEVLVYMEQPNPYIAPTNTPTNTPTATMTPTITPTPSNTPTTTPDFLVVVTSTQGSAMAIERKADFGQIMIFGALMALFGLLLIAFGYYFWTNRNNA